MAGTSRGRMFSKVEALLLVLMIGTLGAVLMPQLSSAGEDRRIGELQRSLESLQQSIDLYRARDASGRYPDLLGSGWKPLIERGFLERAPENPLNGHSDVSRVASPGHGWHFDPQTGRLGACYFDEPSGTITERP